MTTEEVVLIADEGVSSMAGIGKMRRFEHRELDGTVVYGTSTRVTRGANQEVVVVCEPRATIPLHTHSVDAEMLVVAGSGEVLSGDEELNGQPVSCGDIVFFEKEIPHGFKAGREGLVFISRNGGIVDDSRAWDIDFTGA